MASARSDPDNRQLAPSNFKRLLFDAIHLAVSDSVGGLATPGTMDLQAGMILEPPNLPEWRHFPIREKLLDADRELRLRV